MILLLNNYPGDLQKPFLLPIEGMHRSARLVDQAYDSQMSSLFPDVELLRLDVSSVVS